MKIVFATALLGAAMATSVFAEDVSDKSFKKLCKACHTVKNGDETIVKGGKTGPNLYGVIGRQAGTAEGFKYGKDMVKAGENGLIWTEENLATFIHNPKAFLSDQLGSSAKSKMSYKMKKKDIKAGKDAEIAAFLAANS